jgi:hypothetical protein
VALLLAALAPKSQVLENVATEPDRSGNDDVGRHGANKNLDHLEPVRFSVTILGWIVAARLVKTACSDGRIWRTGRHRAGSSPLQATT